jgi:hypothetical protein
VYHSGNSSNIISNSPATPDYEADDELPPHLLNHINDLAAVFGDEYNTYDLMGYKPKPPTSPPDNNKSDKDKDGGGTSSARPYRKAKYIPNNNSSRAGNVVRLAEVVSQTDERAEILKPAISSLPTTDTPESTIEIPISPTSVIKVQTDPTPTELLTLYHSQNRIMNLLSSGHDVQIHFNMKPQTSTYSRESPTTRTRLGAYVISDEDKSVIYQSAGTKTKIIMRSNEPHVFSNPRLYIRGYFALYGHISASIDSCEAVHYLLSLRLVEYVTYVLRVVANNVQFNLTRNTPIFWNPE